MRVRKRTEETGMADGATPTAYHLWPRGISPFHTGLIVGRKPAGPRFYSAGGFFIAGDDPRESGATKPTEEAAR